VKKLQLIEEYERIKDPKALGKVLKRKQKRNAAKDRVRVPYQRRPEADSSK
jgi:hypothetical protein